MLSCQGMADASSEQAPPSRLGRYELLTPIATGGSATVYLARISGVGGFSREVAVKLLDARASDEDSSNSGNTLLDEARLAARINHPAVVPVLDVGESARGPYLVMEYVEGESLANLLQAARRAEERLPAGIALRILSDALDGLQAAHEATDEAGRALGIVHRDFSPQNILVGVDGTSRLTDFGIARWVDRGQYTRTGVVRGKIGYMSPEQAQGLPLDRATDVWAAGVVAWEVFAGRRLFSGDPVPTLLKIIERDAPTLSSVVAQIPQEVSDVLAWALTRDVSVRCSSASELKRRLIAACAGWVTPASSEEVAELVQSLAAPQLRSLRERARAAQRSSPGVVPVNGQTRRPLWGWALIPLVFLGSLLVVVLLRGRKTDAAPGPAPTATAAATSLPPQIPEAEPLPAPQDISPLASGVERAKPANRVRQAQSAPKPRMKDGGGPSGLAPNPY